MIYIFIAILYFIYNKNKNSIESVLIGILLFSSIAAYFVGRQPDFELNTILLTLYTAALLLILFRGFRRFSDLTSFNFCDINRERLDAVEKATTILGFVVLAVYFYILTQVFSQLLMGIITVQEHKNEGGAAELWNELVPHIFITLGNIIAPLGYFFLSLHFYYLVNRDMRRALKYFIFSLCLVLNGLIALSRSISVQFILLYATILFCLLPILNKKLKKRLIVVIPLLLGTLVFGLLIISNTRFSNYYSRESFEKKAILDNTKQPTLFSALDYFSQWEEDGLIIMKRHQAEFNSWGLYNCSGLAVLIQQKLFGTEKINRERDIKYNSILKEQRSSFHGIISRLIYDFGYVGTIIFILLYSVVIQKMSPRKGVLSFKNLLVMTMALPACVVFWAGNEFSSLNLDLGIIYSFIIYKFIASPPQKISRYKFYRLLK